MEGRSEDGVSACNPLKNQIYFGVLKGGGFKSGYETQGSLILRHYSLRLPKGFGV